MTQPLDAFTTGDFCSGKWPTPADFHRYVWEELRKPKPSPLPKREPGEHVEDPAWK